MGFKLSEKEIRKRLGKLHNYEKIKHPQLKERSDKLRAKIKELEKENIKILELETQIENQKLRIEYLEKLVFGTTKKGKNIQENLVILGDNQKEVEQKYLPKKRTAKSYRKEVPKEEDVVLKKEYKFSESEGDKSAVCPNCGDKLSEKKECCFYKEDLPKIEKRLEILREITKELVETAYCKKCKRNIVPESYPHKHLPGQKVRIGENIKMYITHGMVIGNRTYSQIQEELKTQAGINISDGSIANILEEQAEKLDGAYAELENRILGNAISHFDETTWKVNGGKSGNGKYAWVQVDAKTGDSVFRLGQSRGGGNIDEFLKKLSGDEMKRFVAISDDYGAYKNAFEHHQLCWAHPHRKLRDLSESRVFTAEIKKRCENNFKEFKKIYNKLQKTLDKPYEKWRYEKVKKQLEKKFDVFCIPHEKDPEALSRIKKRLRERKKAYFTCLKFPDIPADNNAAERALRKLVIRRKISFGSRTQHAADIWGRLYSVLLSLWWKDPDNFFIEYQKLLSG